MDIFKRKSKSDIAFDSVNFLIMVFICIVTIYPIWYTLVLSLNDGADAMLGGIYFLPRKFTLDNYVAVFNNYGITNAFLITIARTIIGTTLTIFFTAMVSYGLSKQHLTGRKIYMVIGFITMFFSGGLIPYFLLIKNLHLLDNFLVYIIPAMFSFYNCLIFMTFFRELPVEVEESAKIDGANDFVIFLKMILPMSKPVLATIGLFAGVYHWNDYFSGIIYINSPRLEPIQTFLYRVVAESSSNQMLSSLPANITASNVTSNSIKLATMIVTTLPIVLVYPFLQKYFVKGMLVGAVKG
jgi:putative aldouronate transport system permease protein